MAGRPFLAASFKLRRAARRCSMAPGDLLLRLVSLLVARDCIRRDAASMPSRDFSEKLDRFLISLRGRLLQPKLPPVRRRATYLALTATSCRD